MPSFSEAIIEWFFHHKRDLPWRDTREPYPIWISEVILQQTRVQQGMAYYYRFLERFPSVDSLAEAPEEDVLSMWQGLGYYSRARNLHKAARQVHFGLKGIFPDNYRELQSLKGVGTYTAAAIASFAFGEPVPVVDGNVLRVICRYFGIEEDIRLPVTQEKVRTICSELLPQGKSWEFNQAIMEIGAMVCTPASPDCMHCPLASNCFARKENRQKELPFKSKAKARKQRYFNYIWLEYEGQLAFRKRKAGDIWTGLFEPLLFESDRPYLDFREFEEIPEVILQETEALQLLPAQKCLLSHQEIQLHIWILKLRNRIELKETRWVAGAELEALPKPVIFSKILRKPLPSSLYLIFNSTNYGKL
jgi:A/G-specific adenine glycosylase